MAKITREAYSSPTAVVSNAPDNCGIPCSMVVAFHKDHVFVLFQSAEAPMAALLKL
ncbi:hypothetical protein [Paracoccus indicus]|uniref:hypothetical protein n=1 Tax=Paracoccus indicus TaxID=2079229 RepID=UPI0013B375A8|nr:hypothetical protein [Paracoccus indicus]